MQEICFEKAVPRLLDWYDRNRRCLPWRENPTPYRVLVSEVMLQQTRVETVIPYFERFVSELPDFESLASVDPERLMKLWEGLGYYSRAANLRQAANQVMNTFGGSLPADPDAIRSLCGVGDYTAGAVAAIAFGLPTPAVDGNVHRVMARLTADDSEGSVMMIRKKYAEYLKDRIPPDRPGEFDQALIELGATVCLPNGEPHCSDCPLSERCAAHRQGNPEAYPVKNPRKARRIEELTVLRITDGDRLCLRKRSDRGLLAGMWELPNLPGYPDEREIGSVLRKWGLEPIRLIRLPDAVHLFTHREWHMRGYEVRVAPVEPFETDLSLMFFRIDQIAENRSVPTAFRPYLHGERM
ncbi:MAG: A/G-specific adenine glycosylase [Eubacteriales bacterium]